MAGRSGRTYARDSRGRFASGGGGGKRAASGGKSKGKAAPAAPAASTKGQFKRVFTGKVTPAMKRAIEAPVRAAARKVQKVSMSNGTYSGSLKTRSAKGALTRAKNIADFAMETAKSQAARAKITGSGPNRYASIRGTRVAGTIRKRKPAAAAAPAPVAPAPAPKKARSGGKSKSKAAPAAPAASTKESKSRASVAERKAAMSKQVTRSILDKSSPRNAQRERYILAQNTAAMAASTRGKGSKAARRMAAVMATAKPKKARGGGRKRK